MSDSAIFWVSKGENPHFLLVSSIKSPNFVDAQRRSCVRSRTDTRTVPRAFGPERAPSQARFSSYYGALECLHIELWHDHKHIRLQLSWLGRGLCSESALETWGFDSSTCPLAIPRRKMRTEFFCSSEFKSPEIDTAVVRRSSFQEKSRSKLLVTFFLDVRFLCF